MMIIKCNAIIFYQTDVYYSENTKFHVKYEWRTLAKIVVTVNYQKIYYLHSLFINNTLGTVIIIININAQTHNIIIVRLFIFTVM